MSKLRHPWPNFSTMKLSFKLGIVLDMLKVQTSLIPMTCMRTLIFCKSELTFSKHARRK